MKLPRLQISEKHLKLAEVILIVVTSAIPLFFQFPYRINLFLAWEGAYRMSLGEIPYKDFGTPVGYGFWLLPALFFRIIGPYVYTLIVVQVFINIISGLALRFLLRIFQIPSPIIFLTLLVYSLSYSMFNFWPWYNHAVFVYELIGLSFLCGAILRPEVERKVWKIAAAAFFIALSFLTKQDTGALGFMIAVSLLIVDYIFERRTKTAFIFIAGYLLSMALLIGPFLPYEFTYWFNLGQFPHYARADKFDIIYEFMGASDAIKFYLMIIVVMLIIRYQNVSWRHDKSFVVFTWLVLCILGQASIIQVTSYIPLDGNIYFHSFAFAFIMLQLARTVDLSRVINLSAVAFMVCLWWSGVFWTRFLAQYAEKLLVNPNTDKSKVISKRTYIISNDTTNYNRSKWIVPELASFKRVKIPEGTAEGVKKMMSLPVASKVNLKVLNMSELTSLAYDMGYQLEQGSQHPLWYHKGVAFFDREVNNFCDKIERKEYDLILFEDIPNLNQFYPYEVRACMQKHYKLQFKFLAPRIPEVSYIEVYTKE
jgi:hypothetical protein